MATLSREEMEQIIDSGGSVLHNRQIITNKAALPSAAELAQGDAEATERVRQALEAQRDAIEDQLDHLGQAPKPVSGTPVSGTPVSGTPVSGTPVSGTPVRSAGPGVPPQRPAQPGQVQQAPR